LGTELTYEYVMFVECAEYKEWKENRDKSPSLPTRTKVGDGTHLEDFIGVAGTHQRLNS